MTKTHLNPELNEQQENVLIVEPNAHLNGGMTSPFDTTPSNLPKTSQFYFDKIHVLERSFDLLKNRTSLDVAETVYKADMRFSNLEHRLDHVDQRFDEADKHFNELKCQMERHFSHADRKFEEMLCQTSKTFSLIEQRFNQIDARFNQIDATLTELVEVCRSMIVR